MISDAIILAIITATPPTIVALAALITARKAEVQSKETHNLVNSRMTELLKVTSNLAASDATAAEKAAGLDREAAAVAAERAIKAETVVILAEKKP